VTGGALDIALAVEHEALSVIENRRRPFLRVVATAALCDGLPVQHVAPRPVEQTALETAPAAMHPAPLPFSFAVNTRRAFNTGESAVGVMNTS
jgi:hypothetical protein